LKTYNIHKNIESGLKSLYPSALQGNPLRRFNTLVSMIVGVIESQHVSLAKIADDQAGLIQAQSQVKKNDRWLMNKWIDTETFFTPFIIKVIRSIADQKKELVFVIDGSVVGRNCQTLLVSVLWKGKALPVCWKTIQAPKGHFPQADHLALLRVLRDVLSDLPPVRCVMLGDGEYDGQDWIKALKEMQFEYVLRTAKDTLLATWEGDVFQPKSQDVGTESYLYIPDCKLSSGVSTHFVLWHERAFKDPIALLTNLDIAQMATGYYRKRFKIETLFKDFKSSGFHLHQSKLLNPAKIDRLLIVCGLAYLWLIGLGSLISKRKRWVKTVYKVQKETFNLFTIGKRLFKYLTKNGLRIPDISKILDPLKVSV
jgi:hypothetical protein